MITHAEYIKIQELKDLGLSQRKIGQHLNLSRGIIERWWHLSESEFFNAERNSDGSLENYREYIVSILKLCPQITATNIYYKLKEKFQGFDAKRSSFHRYLKNLREQLGYEKRRLTVARESLPPGQESQIDFGQYKMMSMYGNYIRVYFFTMALSYSNMRFVYFSPDPFTTQTAVKAHEYAYRYFGGRTKTNLYDLDKVFVVSENMGNIVFAKEFETYAKETGFTVVFCRPHDPQSKGRVENLVGYVKQGFLDGRIYEGVDSLNRAALNWLDREANEHQLKSSNYTPRESFFEESKHLIPMNHRRILTKTIYTVTSKTSIIYMKNEYALPKQKVKTGDKVRIEVFGETLIVYRLSDNEFLCKYKLQNEVGNVLSCEQQANISSANDTILRQLFFDDSDIDSYLKQMKTQNPRYYVAQCSKLVTMQRYYTKDAIVNAAKHCLNIENCGMSELFAFLIFKYGAEKAKKHMNKMLFLACNKRAMEIKEEYNGKH